VAKWAPRGCEYGVMAEGGYRYFPSSGTSINGSYSIGTDMSLPWVYAGFFLRFGYRKEKNG